jgi:hypothetical protein
MPVSLWCLGKQLPFILRIVRSSDTLWARHSLFNGEPGATYSNHCFEGLNYMTTHAREQAVTRTTGFNHRVNLCGLVVDKRPLWLVSLGELKFFQPIIIPPMPRIKLRIIRALHNGPI